MGVRYVTKFESIDGSISFTFPDTDVENQFEQTWRTPQSIGIGADYAHDHLGYGVAPVNPRVISIRCQYWETSAANLQTKMDEAQAEVRRIGLGYLYRVDEDGATLRRCLARAVAAPSILIDLRFGFGHGPVEFRFAGLSDWMATAETSGSQTIDTALESVTVNNPGNLPVFASVWRLRNNGATPAESPVLFNTTTGQYAAFNRRMNIANHELYLDVGARLVQFSDNDGASYANDYSNFAGDFFRLDPGNNVLKVMSGRSLPLPWLCSVGVPNFDLSWSFYPNYT